MYEPNEIGPLYREENGQLFYWKISGLDLGNGLIEAHEETGPVGRIDHASQGASNFIGNISPAQWQALREEHLPKKKREGYVEKTPDVRFVLRIFPNSNREMALELREGSEDDIDGWLIDGCNGRVQSRDIGGGFAYLFFDVIDAGAALKVIRRSCNAWTPFEHFRIGRLQENKFLDVTTEESAEEEIRILGLNKDGVRRFTLTSVEGAFETGTCADGRLAIVGLARSKSACVIRLYLFDSEGERSERRDIDCAIQPKKREFIYEAEEGHFQQKYREQLAALKIELGFTEAPIRVLRFFSLFDGVGIDEAPLWLSAHDAELWHEQNKFLFWWGAAYTPNEAGALVLWRKPGEIEAVTFTGPSFGLDETPGAPEKILIPYEDSEHSRFNSIGSWDGGLFVAVLTGADPIHASTNRPMYPNPNDPEWPRKKRWYGAIHLFDKDGHHQQTIVFLGGTTASGKTESGERSFQMVDAVLKSFAPLAFEDVSVRPFGVVVDGYLFGLVYEPAREDEGSGYAMLWPNDVMFHEPWDGSYST